MGLFKGAGTKSSFSKGQRLQCSTSLDSYFCRVGSDSLYFLYIFTLILPCMLVEKTKGRQLELDQYSNVTRNRENH